MTLVAMTDATYQSISRLHLTRLNMMQLCVCGIVPWEMLEAQVNTEHLLEVHSHLVQ